MNSALPDAIDLMCVSAFLEFVSWAAEKEIGKSSMAIQSTTPAILLVVLIAAPL
jgi:hypothetical protein